LGGGGPTVGGGSSSLCNETTRERRWSPVAEKDDLASGSDKGFMGVFGLDVDSE
jgi:hypothetical protein